MDRYQERYIKHQEDKKLQLKSSYGVDTPNLSNAYRIYYKTMIEHRSSQRNFNNEVVTLEELEYILSCVSNSPSSCDRFGVRIRVIDDRDTKQLLGGLLVGGTGWIHRADKILLLLGDNEAYKENLDFMKYLDAGVMAMNIYMACEALGIGTCFVNPNIRDEHKDIFRKIIPNENLVLCGAMPIGHFEKHPVRKDRLNKYDLLITDEQCKISCDNA